MPKLAIYITALLNHMSPTPNSKGAPRDATLRNAGEILVQTDLKDSSMPYEEDVLGIIILVVNIQFNKQRTKITCPILYARG